MAWLNLNFIHWAKCIRRRGPSAKQCMMVFQICAAFCAWTNPHGAGFCVSSSCSFVFPLLCDECMQETVEGPWLERCNSSSKVHRFLLSRKKKTLRAAGQSSCQRFVAASCNYVFDCFYWFQSSSLSYDMSPATVVQRSQAPIPARIEGIKRPKNVYI